MKERFLKSTLLIFFVAGIFSSCKKNEDEMTPAIDNTDSVAMIFPVQGMYIGRSNGSGIDQTFFGEPYDFTVSGGPFGVNSADTFYVDSISAGVFQIRNEHENVHTFILALERDSIFSADYDTSCVGCAPDFSEYISIIGSISQNGDSLSYNYHHNYSWSYEPAQTWGGGNVNFTFKGAHQ